MNNRPSPPKLLLAFFRWFCHPDYAEDIEGDLLERFEMVAQDRSLTRAKWMFFFEVLKLMKPSLVKHNISITTNMGLFYSHFKTAARNIRRNALFSMINIFGLSLGLSVVVFLFLFLQDLDRVDDFHEQKENIYQVTSQFKFEEHGINERFAFASNFLAEKMRDEVPQVGALTTMRPAEMDLIINRNAISANGFFVDSTFFDVFSFQLKQGQVGKALNEPYTVILTESTARKLFGDQNPIGQKVEVNNFFLESATVTGVLEDLPSNSSLKFDVLISFETLEAHVRRLQSQFNNTSRYFLGNYNSLGSYVFFTLQESADLDWIQQLMDEIMQEANVIDKIAVSHTVYPYMVVARLEGLEEQLSKMPSVSKLYYLILLVAFIMLMACFNYTNLSLARSFGRTREIGVRKVIGASGSQIFGQVIIEAALISLLAFFLGMIIFLIFKPLVLYVLGKETLGFSVFSLNFSVVTIFWLAGMMLMVSLVSGLLPAIIFSKLKSVVLFENLSIRHFSGIKLRYVLTTFQFIISVGLMSFSYIVFQQYQYIIGFPLGFDASDVMCIRLQNGEEYSDKLMNELQALSFMEEISASSKGMALSDSRFQTKAIVEGTRDTIYYAYDMVSDNHLSFLNFSLIAGTNEFNPLPHCGFWKEIVVNADFVSRFNLGSTEDAIGKKVMFEGQSLRVIGVVENFINSSLKDGSEPFAFVNHPWPENFNYLYIKVGDHDRKEVIGHVEEIYRKYDYIHPFQMDNYEDLVAESYSDYLVIFSVIGFLTGLAMLISALGLFGIGVYTVESRLKEISIRKVLGARLDHLAFLLAKPLMLMLLVASILALPTAIYYVKREVLDEFAYHVNIGLIETAFGVFIGILIIAIIVLFQTRWINRQNPANLLRDE